MSLIKNLLKQNQIISHEDDTIYFLKKKLDLLSDNIKKIKWQMKLDYDFEFDTSYFALLSHDLGENIEEFNFVKFQLNIARKRLNVFNNRFVKFAMRVNLNTLISLDPHIFIWMRPRFKYVQEMQKKIRLLSIQFYKEESKKKIDEKLKLDYFFTNKYNYYLLCNEDEDVASALEEAYVGEQLSTYNLEIKKKNKFIFSSELRPLPEDQYIDSPLFPNIFLLDRLKLLLNSFKEKRQKYSFIPIMFRNISSVFTTYWRKFNSYYNHVSDGLEEIELERMKYIKPPDISDKMFRDEFGEEAYQYYMSTMPVAEMEGVREGVEKVAISQESNVILTEHTAPSVATGVSIDNKIWKNLCSTQSYECNDLTNRFQFWKSFEWSTASLPDGPIGDSTVKTIPFEAAMPLSFVRDKYESPNCILFKTFSYLKTDMEIRIQVNCSPFYQGSLQASIYYAANLDLKYPDRRNIGCGSQMLHTLIDASSANDGILYIPYKYYKPVLGTCKRVDDRSVLNLCALRVLVLNRLFAPEGSDSVVKVNVFVRFVNMEFTGMKPRNLGSIEAEMFSTYATLAGVNAVSQMVNHYFPDPQRDNPPNITPPMHMVPWSAHSWCIGDQDHEPVNMLRLQAPGQVTHPPGSLSSENEMEIKTIIKKFGFIDTIVMTDNFDTNKILVAYPFSPILKYEQYKTYVVKNIQDRNCHAMPPIGVISSLFNFWRGGIKFRFDFICTPYHSCRLLIGFIPRLPLQDSITVDQLTQCDHVIFDLGPNTDKSVEYVCRYVSDKPVWPRRRFINDVDGVYAPGYVYVLVMNPLRCMKQVRQAIDINVYMAADDDFEIMVPMQPTIGLSFNTDVIFDSPTGVTYEADFGPPMDEIYVSNDSNTYLAEVYVVRYGALSDKITPFTITDIIMFSSVLRCINDSYGDIFLIPQAGGAVYCPYSFLIPKTLIYPGFQLNVGFMIPILIVRASIYPLLAKIAAYFTANNLSFGNKISDVQRSELIALYTPVIAYAVGYYNKTASDTIKTSTRYFWNRVTQAENDERDKDAGVNLTIQSPISLTNHGMLLFGEKFESLKAVCRRYQPYCIMNVPRAPKAGYRLTLWIQHRQDYITDKLQPLVLNSDNPIINPRQVFNTGYGYMIQSTDINEILEFEVPFYNPNQYMLLQRPDFSIVDDGQCFGLGSLMIGFVFKGVDSEVADFFKTDVVIPLAPQGLDLSVQKKNYFSNICRDGPIPIILSGYRFARGSMRFRLVLTRDVMTLYYCLADDFSATLFQGYPLIFDIEKPYLDDNVRQSLLHDYVVDAEMESPTPSTSKSPSFFDRMKAKVVNNIVDTGIASVEERFAEKFKKAGLGNVDASKLAASGDVSDVLNAISSMLPDHMGATIWRVFSELVSMYIGGCIQSVVWGLCKILVELGLVCRSLFKSMCHALLNLGRRIFSCQETTQQNEVVEAAAEGPVEETVQLEAAFISTLVTGVLALVGAKNKPLPDSLPNFASYLYGGSKQFALTSNGLFTFFKNNLTMIKKIWYWVVSWVWPEKTLAAELEGCDQDLENFVRKTQYVLDARNAKQIRRDPYLIMQVYECANVAQVMLAKFVLSEVPPGKLQLFIQYCKDVIKLRDVLAAEMLSPPVRFEPFVIGLCGKTRVGKSHIAQTMSHEFLSAVGYKSYEEHCYTKTPGNAYWNGLSNQPCLLYDDFYQLKDPIVGLAQIGELFCLKSLAPFNPPMADIPNKNKRYNPLVVFLAKQVSHPQITGIEDPTAVYNRVDTLWNVQMKKEYVGKHPKYDIPKSITSKYGHLEFFRFPDVAQANVDPKPYSYSEFLAYVLKQWVTYYEHECIAYNERLIKLKQHMPDVSEPLDMSVVNMSQHYKDYELMFLNRDQKREYKKALSWIYNRPFVSKVTSLFDHRKKQIQQGAQVAVETGLIQECDYKAWFDKIKFVHSSISGLDKNCVVCMKWKEVLDSKIDVSDITEDVKVLMWKDQHLFGATSEGPASSCVCLDQLDKMKYYECGKIIKLEAYTCLSDEESLQFQKRSEGAFSDGLGAYFFYKECDAKQACDLRSTIVYNTIPFQILMDTLFTGYPCTELDKPLLYRQTKELADRIASGIPTSIPFIKPTPVVTVDAVLEELNSNDVKSWREKLWDKIPSFKRVVGWLGKLAIILVVAKLAFSAAVGVYKSVRGLRGDLEVNENVNSERVELSAHELQVTKDIINVEKDKVQELLKDKEFVNNVVTQKYFSTGSKTIGELLASGDTISTAARPKTPPVVTAFKNSGEQFDQSLNKILRNTFWLTWSYKDNGKESIIRARCLGIVNRYFLTLDHYIYDMLRKMEYKDFCLYVETGTGFILVNPTNIKLQHTADSAMLLGQLPYHLPMFKDIVSLFATANSHMNLDPHTKLVEIKYNENKRDKLVVIMHQLIIKRADGIYVNNGEYAESTFVRSLYAYNVHAPGMCGSVLLSCANTQSPILGIHIAGKHPCGYAEIVTRESFECLRNLPMVLDKESENANFISDNMTLLPGNMIYEGEFGRKQGMSYSGKSRLGHTECFGEITASTYDFPILHKNDSRINGLFSPLIEGIKHHGDPAIEFGDKECKLAYESLQNKLLSVMPPVRLNPGKLSYQIAICGIPNNFLYEGIDMSTSEGFPWLKNRPVGCKDKSWLFKRTLTDSGFVLDSINVNLEKDLDKKDFARKEGKIQNIIFCDTLKDCKLPKEVVLTPGKTRIFSVSPIDYTIHCRQYFLDFCASYQANRIENESAVGIDIGSYEATRLVNWMTEFSNKMIVGDYSKFGDKLMSKLVFYAYSIIINWYIKNGDVDVDNARVRRILGEESRFSLHLINRTLYRMLGGMPSGQPLTVIINTLVNSMYVRVVWMLIMSVSMPLLRSLYYFDLNVRCIFYGDDLWLSVKDEVCEYFNTITMSACFANYNIKFTDANKLGQLVKYRIFPDNEITFLKRSFHPHPFRNGIWLAKLDERAALEICNWYWTTQKDIRASSITACGAMLEGLFGAGPILYEEIRNKIILFWQNKCVHFDYLTWIEMDDRIYEK